MICLSQRALVQLSVAMKLLNLFMRLARGTLNHSSNASSDIILELSIPGFVGGIYVPIVPKLLKRKTKEKTDFNKISNQTFPSSPHFELE